MPDFSHFFAVFTPKKNAFLSFRGNQDILSKMQETSERKIGFWFFLLPNLSMLYLLQVTDANIGTHQHSNNIIFE